jgi:hypothetical protein
MDGSVIIKMPLKGHIAVIVRGNGKEKVQAVERFEKIRGRLKKPFRQWYEMQFSDNHLKKVWN